MQAPDMSVPLRCHILLTYPHLIAHYWCRPGVSGRLAWTGNWRGACPGWGAQLRPSSPGCNIGVRRQGELPHLTRYVMIVLQGRLVTTSMKTLTVLGLHLQLLCSTHAQVPRSCPVHSESDV